MIPILTYQNFLIIHDNNLKTIELLEKQDGKLIKLDSINHFLYKVHQLTPDKFVIIRNDLSYFIYTIEGKKLSKIHSGKIGRIDEDENLQDINLSYSHELIIVTNRRLIFLSFSNGKLEIKQVIDLLYQEQGHLLEILGQNLFALTVMFELRELRLYVRTKGIWSHFQTLSNSINEKQFNGRIITLPPERKELISKAELLPIQIPLELKILIVEFF